MKARRMILALWAVLAVATPGFGQELPKWEPGRFAYVTAEADSTLAVVDLRTEQITKTLPTGKRPHALVFAKEKGYVNNRGTRDLTVIDGNAFSVLKTIPLPATSWQLELSPGGKTLAVAYRDALALSLIDTATDTIVKTIPVGKAPEKFTGAMMRHPYWSRDGKYVYVQDDVNNALLKIEALTLQVATTLPLPGPNHYLHPTRDGRYLYALNERTKGGISITVIEAATDRLVKEIPVPLEPGEPGNGHHGEFSEDGRFFYFCNMGGRTVAVIDTVKMEVVKALQAGAGAGHPKLAKDGKHIFVVAHKDNVVTVIDTARQEVAKHVPVGTGKEAAHTGYFTPDGRYFYMVNAEDNVINKIDVARMEVVSRISVGRQAMMMVVRHGLDVETGE